MSSSLRSLLSRFRSLDSIEMAAVVAHDGLLIESASRPDVEVDAICAVASNGLAMAEALGREIHKGEATQTLLEYKQGLVLLEPINEDAMLLLMANAREELGQVRFLVALHRQDLAQALDAI